MNKNPARSAKRCLPLRHQWGRWERLKVLKERYHSDRHERLYGEPYEIVGVYFRACQRCGRPHVKVMAGTE